MLEVDEEEDIVPHVVVQGDVVAEAVTGALEQRSLQVADKATILLREARQQ